MSQVAAPAIAPEFALIQLVASITPFWDVDTGIRMVLIVCLALEQRRWFLGFNIAAGLERWALLPRRCPFRHPVQALHC